MSNFNEELDYEFEENVRASTPINEDLSDGDVTIDINVSGQLYRDNPDAVEREVRVLRLHNIKANRLGPIVPALAPEIFQPAALYRKSTQPQRVFAPPAKPPKAEMDGAVAGPSKAPCEKKKKDDTKAKEEKREEKKTKSTAPKALSAAQMKLSEKKKSLWRLRRH